MATHADREVRTVDNSEVVVRRPAGSLRTRLAFGWPVEYRVAWVALVLLVLCVLATSRQTFGSSSTALITAYAGVLLVASLGQMLVVITGGIDLSVSAVMTLGAAIIVRETNGSDGRLGTAWLIALIAAAVIGAVNGVLVRLVRLNPLIVTLAMNGVVTGGLLAWTGVTFSASGQVPPSLFTLATKSVGSVSVIGIGAFAGCLVVAALLHMTRAGRHFVAIGTNPSAARAIGLRVTWHQIGAYVVGAMLYVTAGAFLGGELKTPDYTVGTPYLLLTFVAVALAGARLSGGPASVAGVLAASLFLSLLDQYLAVLGVSGGTQELLQGVILVVAVSIMTLVRSLRLVVLRGRRADLVRRQVAQTPSA